jgi:hypothetical protein
MVIGLLWHDSSDATLGEKVTAARARYEERFGRVPNVCYVNPSALPEGDVEIAGMMLRPAQHILRYHYWVGVEAE